MMRTKILLLICMTFFSVGCLANEDLLPKNANESTNEQEAHKDKCQDLAIISYLSATENLSKLDKKSLAIALKEIQGRASTEMIKAALRFGATSHGNHGEGLTKINAAREDGLLSALDVHYLCLINDLSSM